MLLLSWFVIVILNFCVTESYQYGCSYPKYDGRMEVSEYKCQEYKWMRNNTLHNIDCRKYQYRRNSRRRKQPNFGITNGKPTKLAEYPHMAALGWFSTSNNEWVFLCGASLISDFFLLTAAHCTETHKQRDLTSTKPTIVRMGARNIHLSKFEIPQDYDIGKIYVHGKYISPSNAYDIALVKTAKRIKFTRYVHPACLGILSVPLPDIKYTVTGWGVNGKNGASDILLYGEVDLIDQKTCNYLITPFKSRNWKILNPHQICAGKLDGSVDTCQGDSGGPLQYKINNDLHRIIGITIFGLTRCARVNVPSLYTKVSYFKQWIEERVWKEEYDTMRRKIFYNSW